MNHCEVADARAEVDGSRHSVERKNSGEVLRCERVAAQGLLDVLMVHRFCGELELCKRSLSRDKLQLSS